MPQSHLAKASRGRTNLDNWRKIPHSRWAFHNVRQVIPTAPIEPAARPSVLPSRPRDLSKVDVLDRHGHNQPVSSVMQQCHTDALLVMHQGHIVEERYFRGMRPQDPHILMSVSKSVTAAVAGIMMDRGQLDAEQAVGHYMPQLNDSGFADATVQQLLDMRTGLAFDEDYLVTEGIMIEYREACAWNSPTVANPETNAQQGLHGFLTRLRKGPASWRGVSIHVSEFGFIGVAAGDRCWPAVPGLDERTVVAAHGRRAPGVRDSGSSGRASYCGRH